MKWLTREGKEIPVKEMKDTHLMNTIKFIRRKFMERAKLELEHAYDFGEPTGEMAQDSFNANINHLHNIVDGNVDNDILELELSESVEYEGLIKEAEKRNLNMVDYWFQCRNRDCKCLSKGIGLYFFTKSIKEAEEHSRENNSAMDIIKDSNIPYESQKETLDKLMEAHGKMP